MKSMTADWVGLDRLDKGFVSRKRLMSGGPISAKPCPSNTACTKFVYELTVILAIVAQAPWIENQLCLPGVRVGSR
jgi:hypothetical protein